MNRGVQLSVKPNPPDKSVRPDHPTARPRTLIRMDTDLLFYIFSGFKRVMDYPFFVRYPPDPPNTYIKIKSNPTLISFFSHIFSAASLTPSLLRSHASITPMPPSGRHSLTVSLCQSLTSRLTPTDPSLPHSLTPSDPSLPSRPHSLRSMPPLKFGMWF